MFASKQTRWGFFELLSAFTLFIFGCLAAIIGTVGIPIINLVFSKAGIIVLALVGTAVALFIG